MAIRNWSFTGLWAINAGLWALAALVLSFDVDSQTCRVIACGLAMLPILTVGAWAGAHDEVRHWHRIRFVAMWLIAIVATFSMGSGLTAIIVCAPVGILTIRWIELRSGGTEIVRRTE